MSVIGFDIGNENCVVAVEQQTGIDVVLNGESRRETPAMVSFGEKHRFLGSAAAACATMNLESTVSQVKRLIGRCFDDAEVQYDLSLVPFRASRASDGGILIHTHYLGHDNTFTPTQILAMIFSHLKQIAVKNLEAASAFGCVIGIPAYYTKLQRRAYLEAAHIAELWPRCLMHEPTAISIAYGMDKTDLPDRDAINVVFVDIGHSDTQVSVAAFRKGHLKMLSHAFDRCLGGRDFDEVLFNHFAEKFKEEYKIDVRRSVRASLRLRAACEKLKKVLSANADGSFNVESLMDDKDVGGFITREEFEMLSGHLLEKLKTPCLSALEEAQLRIEKIYAVEVVGSGSRIPAVLRVLSSIFCKEPSRTLNASESIARGCALRCAMFKPTYKGCKFQVEDSFPFPVALCWGEPVLETNEGSTSTRSKYVLLPRGYPISRRTSTKIPTFVRNGTFTVDAVYFDAKDLPPGTSTKISTFTIDPFQASESEKQIIKLEFCLNLHGIVTIESVSLEKRNARANLSVKEVINGGSSQLELKNAIEKEFELAKQDKIMEETKEKKNAVESYVYDMRNKLSDIYRNCATDSEREELFIKLQQTEDWLYEEGDDESKEVYTDKLEELKNIGDPIEQWYKEEVQVIHSINLFQKLAQSGDPKFEHIDPKEIEKLIRHTKKMQQHSQSDAIRKRAESLQRCCEQILSQTKRKCALK